jgi:hypothetical protein
MHFCAFNFMTLTLQDGHYVVTAETGVKTKDGRTVTGTWTVETFSPDSVILRRVDATGFTGVYKGQISKDGNRLVNITLDGDPDPKMRLTWGSALNETPGGAMLSGIMMFRRQDRRERFAIYVASLFPPASGNFGNDGDRIQSLKRNRALTNLTESRNPLTVRPCGRISAKESPLRGEIRCRSLQRLALTQMEERPFVLKTSFC